VEHFRDNWSYLKVEINWLERILLTAAAKARKTDATFTRFAKNKADRSTHTWWEGLVTFDKVGYDSPPPPPAPKPAMSYQQQLDARIQKSQSAGVILALPMLCDRHHLSLFEKQAILLAMAPEVHRRYGELCGYLTGQDNVGLPTVDLALRLFCRDDRAWRQGRSQLLHGKLTDQGILIQSNRLHQSFLEAPLKLAPDIVSYLLAEQPLLLPDAQCELQSLTAAPTGPLSASLEKPFQQTLTRLSSPAPIGQAAQWIGLDRIASPDEKINFYHHLAQALNLSIVLLDLATLTPMQQDQVLHPRSRRAERSSPTLLVITAAQRWLSRSGTLDRIEIPQLIQALKAQYTWIIFDLPYPIALSQHWRSWITVKLEKK
jgi:hypothetical protein